ncbi:MAG: hypothetical protein DI535_23470 [Citrobacter freundii]|nr:MAG: hypothetical protein DI535_23470 [Citrobacter freundii]
MDAPTIDRHIQQRNFVKISRNLKGSSYDLRGFILGKSASLLLIQSTHDFLFDGYEIIRRADVINIRNGKFEKTSKRIFREEGLLKSSFGLDAKISLKGWQTVFTDLKRLDYHVIVKCEDKENADFIIGPVKRVSAASVSIQYYDPAGKLENKLSKVRLKEITTVIFGDNYSTVFRKYLTPRTK